MSAKDLLDTIRVETPCEASWDSSLAIITLKALANSSPGLLQPWGEKSVTTYQLCKSSRTPSELSTSVVTAYPGYKPWAEISELLRS
jgi:hypothetical protein